MKIKVSLISRLIVYITSSILLFGVLAIIFVFIYSKNSFLTNNISNFKELSLEQTQETSLILNRARDLVRVIADDELLSKYLENPDQSQVDQILNNFYAYNIRRIYSAIYLIDKNGNTLISTDKSFVGQDYGFRDYFKESMAGKPYVDLAIGVTSKQLGYYFSHPVKNKAGEVLGVVVIKMIPDFVDQSLANNSLQRKIMLVDEYGVVVYSSKSDRLFHSLGQLSAKDQEEIKQKRRYEGLDIKPLQYQIVADNLSATTEITSVDYFDKVDGEEEIINIAEISDLPFFIITEENKDLYNSQAINLALILVVFIFIAVLLSISFIYMILKNSLHLLNDLKIMSDKLKSGDFSYQISVDGSGDLADIASSFNLVAENLQNNQINTEKIITKRTEQLEKINKIMVGRELEMVKLKNQINKYKK